jgi:hypothetical protein
MTLSDLASIGSLVSGVAVLISLIYLAQQTRQNSKHTKALIHQGRMVQGVDALNAIAGDATWMEAVMRGRNGDQTLDDVQAARCWFAQLANFYSAEDLFLQHQEGLIGESRHQGFVTRMRRAFSSPGVRASWTMARGIYDTDFEAFMDDLMREAHVTLTGNMGATWKSLAAAELRSISA